MTKKEVFEMAIQMIEATNEVPEDFIERTMQKFGGATRDIAIKLWNEYKVETVEKLHHEIELLDNRKTVSKPTAIQKANETIAHTIKVVLAEQENPVTITDLLKDARLATYSVMKGETVVTETMTNQKLSSVMKKLVDAKEVVKTIDKKRAFFSIA